MTRNEAAASIERVGLVLAFAAVHAVLWWTGTTGRNLPLGDVTIAYKQWIDQGGLSGGWVGIDKPWVYPVVALLPMLLASIGGTASIELGWLVMVTVLDIVVLALLWRYRVGRVRVAWWWLVFLLALGPIALGRIDTVATAVALAGVVWVARRPAVASALFTVAAWVKVWPAALVGVLLLLGRGRRSRVLLGAAVVTAVVVVLDLLVGGGAHLLSFVGQQTGRGLQIEAPLATPFLWRAAAGVHGTFVYYDDQILTFQVTGAGTAVAAAVSTPLMALVVVAGALLALWAATCGARRAELAPVLALLLVTALIATNKVGSPQYIGWLAVPVVWGFVAGRPSARRFLVPALLALVAAVLTQLIYPDYYDRVLALQPVLLVVLTARNVLEVVVLVWSIVALVRMGRTARVAAALGREARPTPVAQA